METEKRELLSRREVLTGFSVLGASAALAGLAGCSPATTAAPASSESQQSATNAPPGVNSPRNPFTHSLSELVDPSSEWEKIASVGEGAFIEGVNFNQNGQLWFVDVKAHRIFTVVDGELEVAYEDNASMPAGAKFIDDTTLLIVDSALGIRKFNTKTKEYEKSLVVEYNGTPLSHLNDVALDGNGFAYITETGDANYMNRSSKVYRLNLETMELALHVENIAFANGIAVGPDGSVYIAESFINQILVSPPMSSAAMLGIRVFARFNGGVGPDGIDIDSRGNVWAATAGGLSIVAPDGREYDDALRLPESAGMMPTNLAFHDGYVYVTESMLNEVWRIPVKV